MKDKILDVTAQLITQYGFRKFTVDEIAAELGISKKTIYKYFSGKDEIIKSYFELMVQQDEESVKNAIDTSTDLLDKIHDIIYSSHPYKIPVNQIKELKLYYPEEWSKIETLKQFKLQTLKELLQRAKKENRIKEDINFGVLIKILDQISDVFLDPDFLLENKLYAREGIDEALKIIFYGILQ